jgi:hypothetical protein
VATEINQSDQPQPSSPAAKKLLKLAAEAQELIDRISNESEVYRAQGRLTRLLQFPLSDLTGEELVVLVEARSSANEQHSTGQSSASVSALYSAIAQISYDLWKDLWNVKNLFDEASEEEESELMSLWREKVLGMLEKCGQDIVLLFSREEYAYELIGAGASEQEAEFLAKWLPEVLSGGLPPLLK